MCAHTHTHTCASMRYHVHRPPGSPPRSLDSLLPLQPMRGNYLNPWCSEDTATGYWVIIQLQSQTDASRKGAFILSMNLKADTASQVTHNCYSSWHQWKWSMDSEGGGFALSIYLLPLINPSAKKTPLGSWGKSKQTKMDFFLRGLLSLRWNDFSPSSLRGAWSCILWYNEQYLSVEESRGQRGKETEG